MKYGDFGGQYVSEELKDILNEIKNNFNRIKSSKEFKEQYNYYLKNYVGRQTPLYFAENLTNYLEGCKIYLKREDLNHTGSHKINNAIGQILLAKSMKKKHIIAETGAGSHGVAVATVCSIFNIKCTIFMGSEDIKRQKSNVNRMKLLGADVVEVNRGNGTLKDAVDGAFEYLINNKDAYYLIGSAVGPEPYPEIVRYFQKVIGIEARKQIMKVERKLPRAVIACVGGGSNSIGLFSGFINDKSVEIYGVEAAGKGLLSGQHASAIANNTIGIMHGMKTYIMQDQVGNIKDAYSISAGLDYPGIGPEHAYFHSTKRVNYVAVTDEEAIEAYKLLCRQEGIIPALESSHAIAYLRKIVKKYDKDDAIIVNLSGRGDKDLDILLSLE